MKLSVDKIPDEGLALNYREPADSFDYLKKEGVEAGAEIAGPINVAVQAQKRSGGIAISGQLQGSAAMTCSRCLDEITEDISHEFSYNCLPHEAIQEEKEELTMENMDLCYYSGGEIDITALVHEQVALVLPMRPLCKEDCKGLCPECGANLNKGDCWCRKEPVDLRLAALKNIKI
ncbi:MAG: DUF177 domain-containing protein [Deltaproteobacteria bacterium]